jgi:hypothetical protein
MNKIRIMVNKKKKYKDKNKWETSMNEIKLKYL